MEPDRFDVGQGAAAHFGRQFGVRSQFASGALRERFHLVRARNNQEATWLIRDDWLRAT